MCARACVLALGAQHFSNLSVGVDRAHVHQCAHPPSVRACCLQTGTGKTYTMEGGPRGSDDGRKLSPQAGVIPRSIKQIFELIEGNNMDSTVKVSFLELYNEELTDLLSFDDTNRLR